MADNQVETGIVIQGDARGATGALKATATEGEKMAKRFAGVKNEVAGLPDKLGKASTAMLLLQNSTSQLGGKAADAVNKLTAVAGLAATGGPLGLALAGLTAATIAGSAAWDAYTIETREQEKSQRTLARLFAESDTRMREQSETLARLTAQLENFGRSTREQEIEKLEKLIKTTEQSREIKEIEIASMRDSARAMREQYNEIEKLVFAQGNWSASRRLGVKDAIEEAKGLESQAAHLENTAAMMEKRMSIGLKEAEINRTKLAIINETIAAEERAAALSDRQAKKRERQRNDELELIRLEKLKAERLREGMAQADKFVAERNHARDLEMRREFKVVSMLDGLYKQQDERRKARDAAAAAEREAQAAQLAAVMTQTIGIITDSQATATEKLIQLGDMARQAVLSAIIQKISAYAVDAAAGVMANSISSLPPGIGLVVGGGAAAAAFAAVMAWTQKLNAGGFVLPGPQAAGFVRGGVTNRDSVNATLAPNEYVMSTGEVGGFIKFATRLLGNERAKHMTDLAGMRGNRETQRAPVNQQTIVINNKALIPSRNEQIRASRMLAQNARRMRRLGMEAA